MAKNILIGFLFAACIAIWIWMSRSERADVQQYENTIDSIQAVLKDLNFELTTYKEVVKEVNQEQDIYIHRADSLQNLLDNPKITHTCPEKVEILEEQVVELRSGLQKCNEAKAIYVKSIGIQDTIIVNHIKLNEIADLKVIDCKKEARKGKLKAFFAGMGVTGVIVAVLILL